MEHAKLLVHRGATRVTRTELADIEAPPATATWKPIPHATLVSAIHEELTHRNIAVVKEDYAVQRKNSMLFGVMVLNYLQTDEFAAALAFRHANDMSEAVKMYAGVKVFNCDNMTYGSLIFRAVCENQHTTVYRCRWESPAASECAVAGRRGA